tara:strand:+ start:246 stop:404 length:159 start_codon:yes stop_codon:yes gene_type:complete
MTVEDLIRRLQVFNKDKIVVIGNNTGWANIEAVIDDGSTIMITEDDGPVFDN